MRQSLCHSGTVLRNYENKKGAAVSSLSRKAALLLLASFKRLLAAAPSRGSAVRRSLCAFRQTSYLR